MWNYFPQFQIPIKKVVPNFRHSLTEYVNVKGDRRHSDHFFAQKAFALNGVCADLNSRDSFDNVTTLIRRRE